MRLYYEEIGVRAGADGTPIRLRWRQRTYRTAIIHERWRWNGKWWTTPDLRGRCRRYYRVGSITPAGAHLCLELFEEAGQWVLSRVLD